MERLGTISPVAYISSYLTTDAEQTQDCTMLAFLSVEKNCWLVSPKIYRQVRLFFVLKTDGGIKKLT